MEFRAGRRCLRKGIPAARETPAKHNRSDRINNERHNSVKRSDTDGEREKERKRRERVAEEAQAEENICPPVDVSSFHATFHSTSSVCLAIRSGFVFGLSPQTHLLNFVATRAATVATLLPSRRSAVA